MDAARLDEVPLFSGLSRRERKAVAQHADEASLAAETRIVEEGRPAHEVFVITSGTADVFEGGDKIRELGPGEVICEIGVLETHQRTATVIATSPIEAIVMNGPELRAMANSLPDVHARLQALIAERPH